MSKASRRTPGPGTAAPTSTRVGRRERTRTRPDTSRNDRLRRWLLGGVAVGAIVLVGGFLFLGASSPSYACSTEWDPQPTPTPAEGVTPRMGFVQPDMGTSHNTSSPQNYVYCPPASGPHYPSAPRGPIPARVYGPDEPAEPMGWIHNLEHGALVVLYRCAEGDAGCEEPTQRQLRDLASTFPPSPICNIPAGTGNFGPVVARFDEMAWPYAALVWGRVLPLETLDTELVREFYAREGERTNPEAGCPRPSPGDSPSPSPASS